MRQYKIDMMPAMRWLIAGVMLLSVGSLSAQRKNVTGTVTDETGAAIIGASVIVEGTTRGSSTNANGEFKISAEPLEILQFSYIGYQTKSMPVGNQTNITVQLESTSNLMDDVVVVGYGTSRRADLTGAVASVSAKSIEGYKSGSVVEALGGRLAGVQITSADGTPGAAFDIKIRGIGTVTGDASPLYIVDGFEVSDIGFLSNSDIENVDVLKDASASAIYGARAANGVVLVTTKSGKEGRPIVTYNGSASYRNISRKLDMLDPYEFVKLQMDINAQRFGDTYYKQGEDEYGVPYKYQSLEDYRDVKGINWQSETFKPTWSQDHNVSVSGGTNATKYTFSFSNYSENGIFKNSSFEKTNAKMRINQKLNKWATIDATLTYNNSDRRGDGTSTGSGHFNLLKQVLSARPTGGLKVSDEVLLNTFMDPLEDEYDNLNQVNPIINTENTDKKNIEERWIANLAVTLQLMPGLSFKSTGTYNAATVRIDEFHHEVTLSAKRNGGAYGQSRINKNLRWQNNNVLNYKHSKGGHSLEAMLGQEISFNSSEFLLGQAMDFPFDVLGVNNLGLGATPSNVNTGYSEKLLISFFGRANYSYDNRYFFTATVRRDGSSVFSDNNKWGWFPSFSGAWRISEEKFMRNVPVLSDLKLRAGWGMVGNDRITSFLSQNLYTEGLYGVGTNSTTVLYPKQLPNYDLKWEASQTINLGLDLGLLKNRLNITVDVFQKDTKDLLLAKSLAYVTGFSSQQQNIGKIRNKGLEISFSSLNFVRKDFSWSTDFNISFIRNQLKALAGDTNHMLAYSNFNSSFNTADYIAIVGQSLGLMYGYQFDGIYQVSDFNIDAATGAYVLKPGVVDMTKRYTIPLQPGMVKYKDIDGDGVITDDDRTVIGNGTPKWFGGITNTLNYKGVDFSFMFQFNYGNKIYNATRMYMSESKTERTNKMAEVANRWTPENASNAVPSVQGYVNNETYSRFIEDGSYLRLKTVTLGYTLPANWTRKFYVSRLRVYASAQNLFTVDNYSGYDPEVSMRSSNPMMPGFDWGAYPKTRVFTFGLDVQF